jgi:hypothetical protein
VPQRIVRPAAGIVGRGAAAGGAGAAAGAVSHSVRSGTAAIAGQPVPRQKPLHALAEQAAGSGTRHTQQTGSGSLPVRGRGPTRPAASVSAQPQQNADSVGLDAEAAAWAAAEAARKAGRGGTAGKSPGTAATDAVKQALEKRVQQQQAQRMQQQQAGRASAAASAAGEGRPIADAAKFIAGRIAVRSGQQTPAASRPQPHQHQQGHQRVAANQRRGAAAASGRADAQAQLGPSGHGGAGAAGGAQTQHDPQLRAALLARLKKQGKK